MLKNYLFNWPIHGFLFVNTTQLIKEKRKALLSGGDDPSTSIVKHIKLNYGKHEDENIPTRKIFIDHVISNDTKFTDAEVRDHVYTVVAAGSETTALQTAHTSKNRKLNSPINDSRNNLFQSCFSLLTRKSKKR